MGARLSAPAACPLAGGARPGTREASDVPSIAKPGTAREFGILAKARGAIRGHGFSQGKSADMRTLEMPSLRVQDLPPIDRDGGAHQSCSAQREGEHRGSVSQHFKGRRSSTVIASAARTVGFPSGGKAWLAGPLMPPNPALQRTAKSFAFVVR